MLTFNEWTSLSKINECVIAKLNINGSNILIKNRDRVYIAPIEIVHEIIDGIEVAYLHDKVTDWSEGINEFGIGIVNSALQVKEDEKQGVSKKKKSGMPKTSHDSTKIRKALACNTLDDALKSIVEFTGTDPKGVGVTGETLLSDSKNTYLIEMTSKSDANVKKIKSSELVVRTNHGIENPDLGYTKGKKKESSHSRKDLAEQALSDSDSVEGAMNSIAYRLTKDNAMNPYRDNPRSKMHTTAQLGYDLDDKILYVRYDEKFGKFEGIVRNLPLAYKPKIQIVVAPVTPEDKGETTK